MRMAKSFKGCATKRTKRKQSQQPQGGGPIVSDQIRDNHEMETIEIELGTPV